MPDRNALLDSINQRKSRTGIVTADRYFREVEGCFNGGVCPIDLKGTGEGDWSKALKDAEQRLTYTNSQMRVSKKSLQKNVGGGVLQFDAIVTTPLRDRDGDVLLTKGAKPDPMMPLLWQHIPMQPIGKWVGTLKHSDEVLKARFVVANTPLGRDAAELISVGALRISHGFEPKEWEPMDDELGWKFHEFEIFETSVVSIPSNVSAVITAVNKGRLETDVMRGWADGLKKAVKSAECECHKKKSSTVVEQDEIEIDAAVTKALKKISDQRSLIDDELSRDRVMAGRRRETDGQHVKSGVIVKSAGGTSAKGLLASNGAAAELKSLIEKRGARLSSATRESLEGCVECLEASKVFDQASAELIGKVLAAVKSLMAEAEPMVGITDPEKSFADIEREYIAVLATEDTDALRKAHRRLSLILRGRQDQDDARELAELFS